MINQITLKNFKPFQEQSLTLKPLTLLSGLNSTGKSSVLQSLLLLRQSYQQRLLPDIGLTLNSNLVNLGTAYDVFHQGRTKLPLEIGLHYGDNNEQSVWKFTINREVDGREIDILDISEESSISPDVIQNSLFTNNFQYLQAERFGPRTFNDLSDYQVRRLQQIGCQGEYTGHFLSVYGKTIIVPKYLCKPNAKKSELLIDQVESWLAVISPGTKLTIDVKNEIDVMTLRYSYGDSNQYRPTNVGFGISYTLPIIVAILSAKPDSLLLIENPEAHLHPKGQSEMGKLLALSASTGVQIILETHSDHVLNGIRIAVKKHLISHDQVQLFYFEKKIENQQSIVEVFNPYFDKDALIHHWPDGFFDQSDKDLLELL